MLKKKTQIFKYTGILQKFIMEMCTVSEDQVLFGWMLLIVMDLRTELMSAARVPGAQRIAGIMFYL